MPFGLEKSINCALYAAGGNNSLELIKVFFIYFISIKNGAFFFKYNLCVMGCRIRI